MYLELKQVPEQLVTFRPKVKIAADSDLGADLETIKVWMGVPRGQAHLNKHGQVISSQHFGLHFFEQSEYTPDVSQFRYAQAKLLPNTILVAGISLWLKSSNGPIVHSVAGIVPPALDVAPYFCSNCRDHNLEIELEGVCPIRAESAALASSLRWLKEEFGAHNIDNTWGRIKAS